MMFSKRVQSSSSHIPYPSSELAPCVSSPSLLVSPPSTPPRGHKRSFSKPMMTWLNRSSSSTSTRSVPQPPQAHHFPKPSRASEPKLGGTRALEQFSSHCSGSLGSGATVVRTPQEALEALSGLPRRAVELMRELEQGVQTDILLGTAGKNGSSLQPPPSPPLPPLPDLSHADARSRMSGTSTNVSLLEPTPTPHFSSSYPAHSRAPSRSVPNLPANPAFIPQQPPFETILLSPIPDGAVDPSKLVIVLETCTASYRTSLRSLTSRPSHLSHYIMTLLSPASEAASVYSNASNASEVQYSNLFNAVFRDHLASSGCLPRTSAIHVFLDRPSTPYPHVLAYLRSLPSTPEQPEMLPRAVQLGSKPSPSRLESLLELRDEARYLGLVELEELCVHEMHRFHRRSTLPTLTGGPIGVKNVGSMRSFRTVVEPCRSRHDVRPSESQILLKGDSGAGIVTETAVRAPSSGSSSEDKDVPVWGKQMRNAKHRTGSPPPGWI